ncbi:hypothetical protein I4U23_023069 [Adineta vaga]|nr:hypothetical protein I4U23_023069 [Adineta vaga]
MSHSLYLKGEYANALKYILDGMTMHEKILPKDHPQLSVDITCIGKLLYKQGKHAEALQRLRYAADTYGRRMTDNNRTYAVILNNIGKTLYRLNRLDESCTYYTKALQFIKNLYSTTSLDHADLAYTWKNIGEIHMARNEATVALVLFEKARDMYRRLFSLHGDHRDIAKCWYLIAQTHVILENDADASNAFETAMRMWKNKLSKYHPDMALCHRAMGEFYAGRGNNVKQAIEHFHAALFIYEMQLEINCIELQFIRNKLTDLRNQQKKDVFKKLIHISVENWRK